MATTYPLAPVLAHCRVGAHDVARLCDDFGVSTASLYRYLSAGKVSERVADRLATHLGQHPCAFWPEWFADEAQR